MILKQDWLTTLTRYTKMKFSFNVSGRLACFTRPDAKVERVSYPVPTASAIIGICESIYWHPGVSYDVNEIQVLSPIKTDRWVVKELQKITKTYGGIADLRQIKAIVNPNYNIVVTMNSPNLQKDSSIFRRRLRRGSSYRPVTLGLSEFKAEVLPFHRKDIKPISESMQLGRMLYKIDYSDTKRVPIFKEIEMVNGVITFTGD